MNKLPKFLKEKLLNNKTSLGEHPAFPPEEEEKFIVFAFEKILSEFDDNLFQGEEELSGKLSEYISEARKLERKNVQELERLCAEIINKLFNIPEDTLVLEMSIVDHVDTSNERMFPEKTPDDFSFDDMSDMKGLTDEIYKRRMLNALICGAAIYFTNNISSYVNQLFDIDSELPSLYKKIMDTNLFLLYTKEENNSGKTTDGGKVDVVIASSEEKPIIKAEGLIFPVLMEEAIRGLLELAISHGLPKSFEKAKYVMSKADFKFAEVWDMRMGYVLWSVIMRQIEKCELDILETGINFFFMKLAEMKPEDFNTTLQEVFEGTKQGRIILRNMFEDIDKEKEEDEFNDYIKSKKDSSMMINDDECFTSQELLTDDEEGW